MRRKDYTGAGQALTRGSPPANQLGGRCEAQHLWLSLAKLAFLAGGGGGGGKAGRGHAAADAAPADPARGAEISRRLELAEVRERLMESRPAGEAVSESERWRWCFGAAAAGGRCLRLLRRLRVDGERLSVLPRQHYPTAAAFARPAGCRCCWCFLRVFLLALPRKSSKQRKKSVIKTLSPPFPRVFRTRTLDTCTMYFRT